MSSVFSSNYRCEQLFSLMKSVRSRTRTRLTDEHLEAAMMYQTKIFRVVLYGYETKIFTLTEETGSESKV
jgi:hypothetical protein